MELPLAVVASRSSLAGALLRTVTASKRRVVVGFLRGLSLDELECLADFEGACALEANYSTDWSNGLNQYRLLPAFFDDSTAERWQNPDDRAHKTFIVLAWLEFLTNSLRISESIPTRD
jgi:hypothetical protein